MPPGFPRARTSLTTTELTGIAHHAHLSSLFGCVAGVWLSETEFLYI